MYKKLVYIIDGRGLYKCTFCGKEKQKQNLFLQIEMLFFCKDRKTTKKAKITNRKKEKKKNVQKTYLYKKKNRQKRKK